MSSILVTIRITVWIQSPKSEIRMHWIIDYAGVRQRSALSEHFELLLLLLLLLGFLLLSDFQSTKAFFISLLIVLLLRTQIGDNILHSRNVTDLKVDYNRNGMPQGSYLGPLTFIMLINGLEAADLTHKYADDTTLTEFLNHASTSNMQSHVDELIQQATNIGMMINVKTRER